MPRAERLLKLLQILRRHRHPVTGAVLAGELGISLRTLYRDIASLQAQGACLDAEPGLGYRLRPGFDLPPLMFSQEELEALVLGSRWVAARADSRLGEAARDALAKIAAVLPADLREDLASSGLLVGPGAPVPAGDLQLPEIRAALRKETKLELTYQDRHGQASVRTVWPIALGFFDQARILAAWCELRGTYRHFRTDRITALVVTAARYPRRRLALLREWRQQEGLPPL